MHGNIRIKIGHTRNMTNVGNETDKMCVPNLGIAMNTPTGSTMSEYGTKMMGIVCVYSTRTKNGC